MRFTWRKKQNLDFQNSTTEVPAFDTVYNNKYYKIIIIFKFEAVVTHSINNTVRKKHNPKEMSIFV